METQRTKNVASSQHAFVLSAENIHVAKPGSGAEPRPKFQMPFPPI
jgi:hypothetical protein